MKKIIFVLLFCLVTVAGAQAQLRSQNAQITGYISSDNAGHEVFLVQLIGNVSGGCNTTGRFAMTDTQLKFKGTRAALMAAFHAQTPVTVFYTETCNSFVNSWDIAWACVGSIPC